MKKVFAGKIRTLCRTALVASCIAVFSISASRADNDPILETLAADDAAPYMELVFHAESGDSRQKLVFGLHDDASTGFDAGRDVLAPPPPPSNFDAKIRFVGEDYLVFYKPTEIKSHSILIEYHPEEGSNAVSLHWEPDSLPGGWDYQLMDTDGGEAFSVNMQDIDSLSSDAHDVIGNGLLLVVRPKLQVPELFAPDDHLENIYPDSISLEWSGISQAVGYHLQVSHHADFDGLVMDTLVHEISYTFVGAEYGTAYFWRVRAKGDDFADSPWSTIRSFTTIAVPTNVSVMELPEDFSLKQNYPNPFNSSTRFSYAVPEAGHVRIDVFNAAGQRVATLVNEVKSPGWHNVAFDAGGLSSGVFIYRLKAGNATVAKPMLLIK